MRINTYACKQQSVFLLLIGIISCGNPSDVKKPIENSEPVLEKQKSFPKIDPTRYNVGFLIMEGTFNTELTAPYDIFQHTIFRKNIKAMNVFTVANTDDAITTFEGMKIIPDYNYISDSIPKIDILVIPSAEHHLDSDLENLAMLEFVKKVDKDALFVTSHCDGAFVLAKAGLLDSSISTTFPSDIDAMRTMFPELEIKKDVLFVHDGKYITSAGGAKSFEAALYLCEFLYGKKVAQELAGGLVMEWNLDNVTHLIVN